MSRTALEVTLVLSIVGCKKSPTDPGPTPPPPPTVASVSVSPQAATLTSLGETATLSAEVRLSNGAIGTQAVTWSSSNGGVATVSGGTVTAVANGQATITAAVGGVSGTAAITVAQAVASVSLLPADTVIKSVARLRASALDARGNPIPAAPLQWESLTPAITATDQSGNLTPVSTGVARIKVTAGAHSATALARTVWNVTVLSDLFPLFEYAATTGARKAISDVNQAHADARAAVIAPVWAYLEGLLPTSGSPTTHMYFTTWPQIWTEFTPFCGGQLLQGQTAWTSCAAPNMQHFFIPESQAGDFALVTRFLTRQFLLASHTASRNFPWFHEGYAQWLAGGSVQGGAVVGAVRPVAIADFKGGDAQNLLAPLDTLIRLPGARYYENLPQRTPVAVRMAQGVLLVAFLAKDYPAVLPAIFARIRATPGAGFTNDDLIQEILTRTGLTVAQLEAAYLAYARSL